MGRGAGKGIGLGHDTGLSLEEGEQVFDEERLLSDVGEAGEELLDQPARARESAGQKCQVAEREAAVNRAVENPGVGAVIAGSRQEVEGVPVAARLRASARFSAK